MSTDESFFIVLNLRPGGEKMNPGCIGKVSASENNARALRVRDAGRIAVLVFATVAAGCSSTEAGSTQTTGSRATGSGGSTGSSTGTGGSGTTGSGGATTGSGGSTSTTGSGGSTTTTGSGGATTGSGGSTTGTGGATTGTGGATTTGSGGATTTTGTGGATTGTGGTTTGTGGTGTGGTGTGGTGGGTPDAGKPDAGGGCNLNTGYLGDDQCILPPPPDKGFQLHIGPSDYKNPDASFLLQAGQEATTDFQGAPSPNTAKAYFFYRQYRMRPTAHHVIITAPNGSDVGRRIGTANKSEDYPTGGVIAPEDKNVGIPIDPNTPISVSFHAINTTTKPQLREIWVNFWYRDPAEVTQPATEWFETGNVTFAIPAHTKTQIGPSTCTVSGNGRLLWAYGHRHANNTRFLMTRIRGTQRDVIYDAYKWDEPLLLDYSSTVTNRAADPANMGEGGWNGILDLMTGDKIEWTCDVNNTTDGVLRFTNNTYTGEMCIIDAEAVTSSCN
jgi:hypothetical protein